MRRLLPFVLAVPTAFGASPEPGLLERVALALEENFYDREFRSTELRALLSRYRPAAEACATPEEERDVVRDFLEEIPVSHLALFSRATFEHMRAELSGRATPTLGFQVVELEGSFWIDWLLEGGPADRAGISRGDRLIAVDGVPVASSERLDWSSDDAALPDPPQHRLLCRVGERVELELERSPEVPERVSLIVEPYSGLAAAAASRRVLDERGWSIGYLHLWYVHVAGSVELLRKALVEEFAGCDALILDLRGRGGSATEVARLVALFDGPTELWTKPLVVLVDSRTRSAKEVLAHELATRDRALIVGERTAGAVIPATFTSVGDDAVLMYPSSTLGRYTQRLEGKGVEPDVPITDCLPFSAGRDPILEAGRIAARLWCEE